MAHYLIHVLIYLCLYHLGFPGGSDGKASNQSILRDINPEYSWEGLMPKLKIQHFDHLMRTADSLEKSLILGKIEERRRMMKVKEESEKVV